MTDPQGRPLAGFDAATYGDRFADVYDDWYADVTDTAACVATVADLARTAAAPAGAVGTGGGDGDDGDNGGDGDRPRVLELGVGTGRLAIPLVTAGVEVTGVDASPAMLAALAAKPGGATVRPVRGDMADLPPAHPALADGRFHVVLIAYNTLFNLVDDGAQQRCLERAAALVHPDGSVVVEAFVPDPGASSGDSVTTRQVTADRVVLSVSRTDAAARLVVGQYVDISEAGVRLRPWQVRWVSPDGLDALAAAAGLTRHHRWADWRRAPFTTDATTHVSVYRRS
jgi:SAM-dependent methyltransferase